MKIQNLSEMESLLEEGDYESILPGPRNSDRVHQSLELKNRFPSVSGEVTRILGILNTDMVSFRAWRRCWDVVSASVERDYGNAFSHFARKTAWKRCWGNRLDEKPVPFRFPWARKMLRLPPRKILSATVAAVEAQLSKIPEMEWRSGERFVTLFKADKNCKKCGGLGKVTCGRCDGSSSIPMDSLNADDLKKVKELVKCPGAPDFFVIEFLKKNVKGGNVPCPFCGNDGKTRCICVSDVTGQLPNPLPRKAQKKFLIKMSDVGYCWLVFK